MPVFRVLGPLEIRDRDGGSVAPQRRKQRTLLGLLLVRAGTVVPTDEIVDVLWGERPPASARANLHSYVSGLRRVLARAAPAAEPRPTSVRNGYRLAVSAGECDAGVFETLAAQGRRALADGRPAVAADRLARALGLWRGTVLEGLDRDDWLAPFVARLDEARLAALEDQTDARLALGQHAELAVELAAVTARYPLRERLWAQSMLALHRCGETAQALAVYDRLCALLDAELGVPPSAPVQALSRRIRADDGTLLLPAGSVRPVPAQLPAGGPVFTGRATELAALTSALLGDAGPGRAVVSAIVGAGGIGKTWLALHWAHQHRDRFPDGQLFVDLRGFDPAAAPMVPAAAIRGFLDALGVEPRAVPVDHDAQVGLYRSLVAARRMLIVLDNARDAAQVTGLLPGSASCAVIVTSRDRLTGLISGYGARPVVLEVLDPAAARRLLARRLGEGRLVAEPAAAERVIAACGGLPLALGIAAARAAVAPRLPVAAIARDLDDAATRLGALDEAHPRASLRAVLSWSADALTDRQARVFALLGLAVGPELSLPAAAALTGLPVAETATALRALERQSLIEQPVERRWRAHDLIRLYAAERAALDLPAADRQAAPRRLVDFYLHTAKAADRLLAPHRVPIVVEPVPADVRPVALPDEAAAWRWLAAEHACLVAAQRLAAERDWLAPVWQLAATLITFQRMRGHLHDLQGVWQAGLAAARRLGDRTVEALAHRLLGDACARVGEHARAADHLGQALALAELIGDRAAQAHTHRVLAQSLNLVGDDRRALAHATRSLRLFQDLDDTVRQANAFNAVGWYSARLGHHERARGHLDAALVLARQHRDRDAEANTLDSLGYLAHRTGRYQEALGYYERALALFHDLGFTYTEADTLERLGDSHAALGQAEPARRYRSAALGLYRTQHRGPDADRVRRQLELDQPAAAVSPPVPG